MADTPNPSIVNDASGNNYGGIAPAGGSLQSAQMEYLNLLSNIANQMPPKAVGRTDYAPGIGEGVQIGSYSGSMVGSVPIFAPTNIIPFGMLDELKRVKAEEEANYYKQYKTFLDKPLTDMKAKLSNPWAQPEFNNKIQQTVDAFLDAYASKNGGNYMKAYVAVQHDKNFSKIMTGYQQYADIYNSVYSEAIETLDKAQKPNEFYVSDAQIQSINEFLHTHDNLENLSIDVLGKKAEEFAAQQSVFKLAEAATAGVQADILTSIAENPTMSTDEKRAYIVTKTTGTKEQAADIFNTVVKTQTWIDKNPAQKELLRKEIENRLKYGEEKSIELIERQDAERNMDLKKAGIDVQPNGTVKFPTRPSALIGAIGQYAINYKTDKNKPIPTISNMQAYVRDPKTGRIVRVTLPESYQMIPAAEYDLVGNDLPVVPGRYIEGTVNFQDIEQYTPSGIKVAQKSGQFTDQIDTGPGRSTTQVKSVQAFDDAGNVVELMGNVTILAPFERLRGSIEGNMEHMVYLHKQIEKLTYPSPDQPSYGERRNYTPNENASKTAGAIPGTKGAPHKLTATSTMKDIKNDANVYYIDEDGYVESGADIYKRYLESKSKK